MDCTPKHCKRCNQDYPRTNEYFYRHSRTKDRLYSICKSCSSKASLKWQAENPDKAKAANKKYRKAHPDRVAARSRRWRSNNREHVRELKRNWRNANIDAQRERDRQRYAANPTPWRVRSAQWRKSNPQQHNALARNYRARKANAEGSHNKQDIEWIGASQDWLCYWCNADCSQEHTVDHIIALSNGGCNGPENLVVACKSCNSSKSARLPEEWNAETRKTRQAAR